MIELNIDALMKQHGKTKYWLVKKLETDYQYAGKLLANETKSISFTMMEKLCELFDCEPGDLFRKVK